MVRGYLEVINSKGKDSGYEQGKDCWEEIGHGDYCQLLILILILNVQLNALIFALYDLPLLKSYQILFNRGRIATGEPGQELNRNRAVALEGYHYFLPQIPGFSRKPSCNHDLLSFWSLKGPTSFASHPAPTILKCRPPLVSCQADQRSFTFRLDLRFSVFDFSQAFVGADDGHIFHQLLVLVDRFLLRWTFRSFSCR